VKSGEQLLIGISPEEFAEHVVRVLSDAGMRRRMAVCARRLAEQQYNWETVSRKMEIVLQRQVEIAANKRSEQEFASA